MLKSVTKSSQNMHVLRKLTETSNFETRIQSTTSDYFVCFYEVATIKSSPI